MLNKLNIPVRSFPRNIFTTRELKEGIKSIINPFAMSETELNTIKKFNDERLPEFESFLENT